jgi:hypothetical protein
VQELAVRSARLDLAAAAKLATAFPRLQALTSIDLSGNDLAWFGRSTADVGSEQTGALAGALASVAALQARRSLSRCRTLVAAGDSALASALASMACPQHNSSHQQQHSAVPCRSRRCSAAACK